jgi:DNA-binding transcriptional ArsR family regulator
MNETVAVESADTPGDDDDDGSAAESESLSTDAVFETLSNRRRRYALHYLKQRNEPVTIRELSEQVAAWENGVDRSSVTPKLRKRVYTALHQSHLPKMSSLDVVAYDSDRGVVSMTPHVAELDIYLNVVQRTDLPWSQFYLGLGAVFVALVTVGGLGIWPFATISGFAYALIVACSFLAIAAIHTVRDARSVIGGWSDPVDHVVAPLESRERNEDD